MKLFKYNTLILLIIFMLKELIVNGVCWPLPIKYYLQIPMDSEYYRWIK